MPEDSWYFTATPSPTGKGFTHKAYDSIPALAHAIGYLERETAQDVYYACSGYRDEFVERPSKQDVTKLKKVYRVKENVKLVKAHWLDLDVGVAEVGKAAKYPDQRAAILALNDFLIKTDLPKPMVVSSGYGIHVYWPLSASILPGQWRATALQLKELAVGVGMLFDHSRTSDEASVLRPVGTSNRKIKNGVAGSMPVRALLPLPGQAIEYVSNTEFHTAITTAMKAADIKVVETDKSTTMKVNPEDMIVPVGQFKKVSAIKVSERCNQLKLFKDTGGVSEPQWYAALQVMQHTVEGEPLAHEWSKVHSGYTQEQTEQKLVQVRGMGPTLCKTFSDKNPDGCKNCPFAGKISTPLQLGMEVEEAPAPVIKEIIDGKEVETELPQPPWPFKRGDSEQPGLYVEIEEGVPVRFYPYDLYPYEIVNDEGKREGSVGVRHWLPREGWRDFNLRLELIESPREFLGKMRNHFVNPENGKYMVTYMDAYLRSLQDKTKIKTLHTKLGWMPDKSFLMGTKLYTAAGTFPAGVSSTVSTKIVGSYHTKGSLETWQESINRFDAPGLEAHLFSVLIGFGAPLFKLTGYGGVIAAMLGETNAGKTLSARAMQSIYGNFDLFKAGKNDTFNARIERMGMLSNLPIYLDETTNIKSEDVSELMYQISSGQGRTRLRADSSVREAAEWSTIVLTSGNRSMVGRLMEAKVDPEAELVRLFEYTVPRFSWFESQMSGIYDVLDNNYGHAGEQYLSQLVRMPQEDVMRQIKLLSDNFQKHVQFNGKERFWYALVACVLYGMWLAQACGAIKLANVNDTYQRLWAWCGEQVLRQRTVVTENKVEAVEALSMFLNAHIADRLVITENKLGLGEALVVKHPAAHGKLMIQYNQTTGLLHIDQARIRNWFNEHQMNPQQIKRDLIEAKIMSESVRDLKITIGKGTQYQGGQTRVWEINAKHPALDGIETILEKDHTEVTA